MAELLLAPSLIVACVQPRPNNKKGNAPLLTRTNADCIARVHVEVEWELGELIGGCEDTSVDVGREASQRNRIDSFKSVDRRIELSGGVVVVCRCAKAFILYTFVVSGKETIIGDAHRINTHFEHIRYQTVPRPSLVASNPRESIKVVPSAASIYHII